MHADLCRYFSYCSRTKSYTGNTTQGALRFRSLRSAEERRAVVKIVLQECHGTGALRGIACFPASQRKWRGARPHRKARETLAVFWLRQPAACAATRFLHGDSTCGQRKLSRNLPRSTVPEGDPASLRGSYREVSLHLSPNSHLCHFTTERSRRFP